MRSHHDLNRRSNMRAHEFIKQVGEIEIKCEACQASHFIAFSQQGLINSIIQEQEC